MEADCIGIMLKQTACCTADRWRRVTGGSMYFKVEGNHLLGREGYELLRVEPWGTNAVRVRVTQNTKIQEEAYALTEPVKKNGTAMIRDEETGVVENGRIRVEVNKQGILRVLRDGKPVLEEYDQSWAGAFPHSGCLKRKAREMKPLPGGSFKLAARFQSRDEEKIFGMGQYQQPQLNLKGCVLELAQRNSQITIPFAVSSLGYGFFWNNPAVGTVMFGNNYTEWTARMSDQLDYWVTVGENPREILANFTEAVGRAPMMPEDIMGLWQCKLRYRTQEEVLEVVREYHRRQIPLDVIIIDYFHWIHQGDWAFDPAYWPDPKAMVEECASMGTKVMVSVWPTVDINSVNMQYMKEHGLLIRTARGSEQSYNFLGDTRICDMTNPEAGTFFWEMLKKNYYDQGISLFWLDAAEPELLNSDFDHYIYYKGSCEKVGAMFPKEYARHVYEGQKADGEEHPVNLLRSAWAGSQKYGTVVWSGDIFSHFQALRDQLAAGLNIGLAGIPWWVSDTGGFHGSIEAPYFKELLVRWFQFGTFGAILRMHGDRGPHNIPKLSDDTKGGGFCPTGQPNELWSYGEDVYEILKSYTMLRIRMKPYIKRVMEEAHVCGAPAIRTMFFEFPQESICWNLEDQYMFGSDVLVAPVLYEGMTSRNVYLPSGAKWTDLHTGETYEGGQTIEKKTPLSVIPVYVRGEDREIIFS